MHNSTTHNSQSYGCTLCLQKKKKNNLPVKYSTFPIITLSETGTALDALSREAVFARPVRTNPI